MNLRDAARRSISYTSPETGKHYDLAEGAKLAVLLVRPRGWHLDEAHVTVDGRCVLFACYVVLIAMETSYLGISTQAPLNLYGTKAAQQVALRCLSWTSASA